MKFVIPFSEEILLKQAKLRWKLATQNILKARKQNLIFAILFSVFGGILLYFDYPIGIILIIIGTVFLNYFRANDKLFSKGDNQNKENIEIELSRMKQSGSGTFEFTDEHFFYSCDDFESKIKWKLISSYTVFDNCLLITQDNNIYNSYMISEEEVGKDNFKKIVALVSSKTKEKIFTKQ